MFHGTFSHTLDDKGRVAIPRKFRELLPGGQGACRVIVTTSFGGDPNTLDLYTPEAWQDLEETFRAMNRFDEVTKTLKRMYLHPAQDLTLDAQGRILLPQDLRTHIDLQPRMDAVFTGDLDKILIWSRPTWERQRSADRDATLPEAAMSKLAH